MLDGKTGLGELLGHGERALEADGDLRTGREWFDRAKARIAVGKAIRRALTRIAAADAVIGDVLCDGVRTGARCGYHPG
ncbi:hypothetical protein [Amycolatopsis sp. cmx-4-68]|uniref:hypothetical protein n=1 Tax=Amycolatopsis sp. cmx-4-68 TaxID=2790938 RepID=UPI0039797C1D